MLSLHDVTVQIGDATLISGVSAEVRPGTLTAVVGPNGAGKTTLLRAASGELAPSGGTVRLDDRPLPRVPEQAQARRRAVLPRASRLHFSFSVLEVVIMGRSPHVNGREGPDDWAIAEKALNAVGMGGFVDRDFPTLSGGEQQRVHLARALAQVWTAPDDGNRYLLLDEPTASLDLAHQQNVLQTARSFADEGAGVLAILHDLNLAAQFADHVVVMAEGQVHTQGAPDAVFTPPCIHNVFGWPVCVLAHPTQSCPLIVPDHAEAETTASEPASI